MALQDVKCGFKRLVEGEKPCGKRPELKEGAYVDASIFSCALLGEEAS